MVAYTIHLSVNDGNGNTGTAICLVTVPKSQNGNPAIDDGPVYTITGSCAVTAKMAENFDRMSESETLPEGYALFPNYPNPFNPTTEITFALPEAGEIKLAIYNLRGQLVRTLVSGAVAAGRHKVVWDGTDANGAKVASGIYVYRLEAKDFVANMKLVLAK